MKKLIFLPLLALLLLLCSCSGCINLFDDLTLFEIETFPETLPQETSPYYAEEGDLIISGETEGCRIVYAKGYADAADELFDGFIKLDPRAYTQIGFYELTTDSHEDDGKPEILIGNTNRPESAELAKTKHTYLDYSIATSKNKIIVYSPSPDGALAAVEYLLTRLELNGDKITYHHESDPYFYEYKDYPYSDIELFGKSVSEYSIIHSANAKEEELSFIERAVKWIGKHTGAVIPVYDDSHTETGSEILIGKTSRPESVQEISTLEDLEYKFVLRNEKVVVAYLYLHALYDGCFEVDDFFESTGSISTEFSAKYPEANWIKSQIYSLRDPYVLVDSDGTYYAYGTYGTNLAAYKNTSGILSGDWTSLGRVITLPEDAEGEYCAPEVREYKGYYYMFATYRSAKSGHRGCAVFRANSPEGPFEMLSEGHVTPVNWDSTDATLYVDEEGQPWMVFVREWSCTEDGVGRIVAAKLSNNLSRLISEPIELFRADGTVWTDGQVTDGCWFYRCTTGELLMIWSDLDGDGYRVSIARSDNGKLDGNWTKDEQPLYSKAMSKNYDGSHGMIFTTPYGQMYLAIHSPNGPGDERAYIPVFIAIREENSTLVQNVD